MTGKEFKDRDEQAAWELLGRHKGIEPSFGFVERTLRRLDQPEVVTRPAFSQLVLRWAVAAVALIWVGVGAWFDHPRFAVSNHSSEQIVTTYVETQQADYLEDFDVIASLDELDGGHKL
jgi:hypothetical protein